MIFFTVMYFFTNISNIVAPFILRWEPLPLFPSYGFILFLFVPIAPCRRGVRGAYLLVFVGLKAQPTFEGEDFIFT